MKWPWHKFPTPFALLKLVRFRRKLREENLHNTAQLPTQDDIKLPLHSTWRSPFSCAYC